MTQDHRSPAELFPLLFELHQECVAAGCIEAAHCALAAALHCASDAGDLEAVQRVERTARARQESLDAQVPSHSLATAQARLHGMNPVFTILASTARSVYLRLAAEAVRRKSERARLQRKTGTGGWIPHPQSMP